MSFDTTQLESKLMLQLRCDRQQLQQVENPQPQPSSIGMEYPRAGQLKQSETVIYGSFKQSRGDIDLRLKQLLHPIQIVFAREHDLLHHTF